MIWYLPLPTKLAFSRGNTLELKMDCERELFFFVFLQVKNFFARNRHASISSPSAPERDTSRPAEVTNLLHVQAVAWRCSFL